MSMISSQCDELRRIADKDNVSYEASDAMYRAADTIWELRNKLAGTVDQSERIAELEAENDKLRELVRDLERARRALCDEHPDQSGVDCDECPAHALCDTNPYGRLRELRIEVTDD